MATKRPKAKDLRAMLAADLEQQVAQLRQELWQQRLKARDGSLQQTHQLSAARRQVARIQTVLREQQGAMAPAKGSV